MRFFFKGLNGEMVSKKSQTGDTTNAGRCSDEGMSEWFPLKNVGKVNFDGRPLYNSKGICQSNAAVGQPSRVDHPSLDVGAILVEKIDQFPFVVALKKRKRVIGKGEFDFIL